MIRIATHRVALAALVAGLLSCLSGCSDDGSPSATGILDAPTPLTGTWGSSATETVDTCGFDPGPAFAPMLIEDNGDSVVFSFVDAYGFCEQSVRSKNGNLVTLSKTDTFDGGCGLVQVHSQYVYEFEGDSFSGTADHRYTVLDGYCSNLPCDYRLAVSGSRCEGCWTGCYEATSARVAGPTPERPVVDLDRLHGP